MNDNDDGIPVWLFILIIILMTLAFNGPEAW